MERSDANFVTTQLFSTLLSSTLNKIVPDSLAGYREDNDQIICDLYFCGCYTYLIEMIVIL